MSHLTPLCGATSPSENLQNNQLIYKLTHNESLNASERAFLVDLTTNIDYSSYEQENLLGVKENDDPLPPKKFKNAKLQVNPEKLIPVCSVQTQTDKQDNMTDKRNNKDLIMPSSSTTGKHRAMLESKRLAGKEKIDSDAAQRLMDELYDERRSFILMQMPVVGFVKEKYPLLFSVAEVRHEIERIFHQGICQGFLKNIGKYANAILSTAKESDPILLLTKEKLLSYETSVQKKYAQEVGSILLLSSIMNENRTFLKLDEPVCGEADNDLLPYIEVKAKRNELFSDEHQFKIYVEKNLLCEAANLKEALLCLIGSFYIFNIEYPKANCKTFSAFEQLYLEKSDSDTQDIDDFALQIIRCLQLKVQASETKSKRKKR